MAAIVIVALVSWNARQADTRVDQVASAIPADASRPDSLQPAQATSSPPAAPEAMQPELDTRLIDASAGLQPRDIDGVDAGSSAESRAHVRAESSPAARTNRPPGPSTEESSFPRDWRRCFRDYPAHDGYSIRADSTIAWSGSWSASIASRVVRPDPAGAGLCQYISADAYRGKRIRITLHLRTLNATPGAHMVFRAEGADGRLLAFYNMEQKWMSGTLDWTAHSVVIDIPDRASVLMTGASLVYTGTLWVDEVSIEIVDRESPITQPAAQIAHYNAVTDPTGLPQSLQNPGFEHTVQRRVND
jgi:hypothetical protein